jgi:hypothetical protein
MMSENLNSVEKILPLIIAEKKYEWSEQYITGEQIKKLAQLPQDAKILLAIKRPWDDEIIEDDTRVDLAREGVEHFIVKPPHQDFLVEIKINDQPHEIKRGKHSVERLREIGHVPPTHLFAELVDQKLVELASDADVLIKGCEQFFSYTREGCSS